MNKTKNYYDYVTYMKGLMTSGIRPATRKIWSQEKRWNDDRYFEFHHIIPKSCGGSDDDSNLVCLTAREHVLAHYLLCDIYKDTEFSNKMTFAIQFLVKASQNFPDSDTKLNILLHSKMIARRIELAKEATRQTMTGKKFDYKFQAECVKEQNFEKLEMYVLELLLGG